MPRKPHIPIKQRLQEAYDSGFAQGCKSADINNKITQDDKIFERKMAVLSAQTELIRQSGQAMAALSNALVNGTRLCS